MAISCDSLGGLYLSVLRSEDAYLLDGVGEKVFEKPEVVKEVRDHYASEERQVAQINFE